MNSRMETSFKRVCEPVILSVAANVLATYLLKPLHPRFELGDFVVACVLMVPVTEFNRYLDHALARKYSWQDQPFKRILNHFLYLALALIITLNVVGNLYILISGQTFFTWPETLLIHGATFVVAFLLTFFNWTLHFYGSWQNTALALQHSTLQIQSLKQDMARVDQRIEFQKGHQKISVGLKTIRLVKIEAGVVRAMMDDEQAHIFPGTLRELAQQLPGHLFFPATRDIIIHREMVQSLSPASYGKIAVGIKGPASHEQIIVSRLKAAAFRKWYYSSSG